MCIREETIVYVTRVGSIDTMQIFRARLMRSAMIDSMPPNQNLHFANSS